MQPFTFIQVLYEYRLLVNSTRMGSFCTSRVYTTREQVQRSGPN